MSHQEYINSIRTLSSIKKYMISQKIKEYKCDVCGISEWQDKKIALECHHKDGNHLNNNIDNLQILCPNCHSQTHFFRGAGKRKPVPEDKVFIDAIKKSYSISDAICRVGLKSASASSYSHVRNLIKKYNLTFLTRPTLKTHPTTKIKTGRIPNKTKALYPDIETMKKLVWEKSLEQLGREWGVNSTAIRYWCARRGIKTPGIGYWRKKQTGNL